MHGDARWRIDLSFLNLGPLFGLATRRCKLRLKITVSFVTVLPARRRVGGCHPLLVSSDSARQGGFLEIGGRPVEG